MRIDDYFLPLVEIVIRMPKNNITAIAKRCVICNRICEDYSFMNGNKYYHADCWIKRNKRYV